MTPTESERAKSREIVHPRSCPIEGSEPMTIARLKELHESADLPEVWSDITFRLDGYPCPEYMAATLNTFPALLKIAKAASVIAAQLKEIGENVHGEDEQNLIDAVDALEELEVDDGK